MKALLLIAALLLTTNAMAADWTFLYGTDAGKVSIDFDSLETPFPGVVQFWRMNEMKKADNVSNDPHGMELGNKLLVLTFINCNTRQWTTTRIDAFMNKKFINTGPGVNGQWNLIAPGSSVDLMRSQLCTQVIFDLIAQSRRLQQVH